MVQLDRVIELLARLVEIPTTPGRANREIVDFISTALAAKGARIQRIPSPLGDADGLILSVGPNEPGGLVLSGHLDVVPVDGLNWSSDPFELRREKDRLYGRGTCDMKGFVACALALAESLSVISLSRPVHVVLSADEETSCRSIESLIDAIQNTLPPIRGVLVGEPTGMRPIDRHKASATHRVEVIGHAVHASMAQKGEDAISLAVRLISWLNNETHKAKQKPGDFGFDPDHSLHTPTRIVGGSAVNTVAGRCVFDWDMRLMPGEDMDDITDRFDAFAKAECEHIGFGRLHVSRTCTAFFPGLKPSGGAFGADLIERCGTSGFGALPFGTEAGFFQSAGIETYVCGPGSVDFAHVADENLPIKDLEKCLGIIQVLAT